MTRIDAVMTGSPACCTPEASLEEAARLMLECDCGEIPVVDGLDTLIPLGVITDRDITCRSIAEGRNPLQMSVLDCMTSPALTCSTDMSLEECLEVMQQNQIRRVPVVDEKGRLCGIVAQANIAQLLSFEETGHMVREVSQREDAPPRSPAAPH